jgi:hypothetical protein
MIKAMRQIIENTRIQIFFESTKKGKRKPTIKREKVTHEKKAIG